MKTFSHDYTKVAKAESHLYAAQQLNAHDDPIEAWKHIQDAREILQQYLAQDNMVEDDDVYPGWVQAFGNDDDWDYIRDVFGGMLHGNPSGRTAKQQLRIINIVQRILGYNIYESVEDFISDDSGTWRS